MKLRQAYAATLALFLVLGPATGFCSNIFGIVYDSQGKQVNGCRINVTDSAGKVIAEGRTDLYGRYCITTIDPNAYTLVLEPGNTGVASGTGVVNLQLEGLTVDWTAAKDKPAIASATPGVGSPAAATCGAAWWDNVPVAAGAFALGGGGIFGGLCGTGVICGSGGGGGPSSSSK